MSHPANVPVIVLNLGQSVLRSLEDYTLAAAEIYRHYRQGQNVVAVTSAQGDQSDMLMAEARRIGPGEDAKNLAELLQLGERRSAALLALALERIGAPAFVRQARDLGLRAKGSQGRGELTDMDTDQLWADLKAHDIVVMPGYVGIGDNDRPVLLGDGGADFTALYVAQNLGTRALLLKDVDGVYEHDPREAGDSPKRYAKISWDDALERAGVLIDAKALRFARDKQFSFEVGTPGNPNYTSVGEVTDVPLAAASFPKLRVAMMGLGVVGGGVYRRIQDHADRFEIVKILTRNPQTYVAQNYPKALLTSHWDEVLDAKPDVFIDVAGGIEPALSRTREMLAAGVHVVSANKQAIAAGGQDLLDFVKGYDAELLFSSAAGGGMPILEMMIRERGRITQVEALLNGTTNYMLDRMSAGASYDEALREAQEKGFAEADPTADVDGQDAGAKIRLLALLGFGEEVALDAIPMETIRGFDRPSEHGRWKRVARVWRDITGFHTALELRDLSENNFIAQALGEEAHAQITFDNGDAFRIRGKGAGRWPTTAAVMADLFDLSARGS
jgi:homoserine dehydrogenase